MFLTKPSDKSHSEPVPFYFYPNSDVLFEDMMELSEPIIPKTEPKDEECVSYPPGGLYLSKINSDQDHDNFTNKILRMGKNELEKTLSDLL